MDLGARVEVRELFILSKPLIHGWTYGKYKTYIEKWTRHMKVIWNAIIR